MTHCRDMAIWNFQDGGRPPSWIFWDSEVSKVLFVTFYDVSHLSWVLYITTSWKKTSKINNCCSEKYNFMHFGGHIGFLAAILDLRQNWGGPGAFFKYCGLRYMNPLRKPWLEKRAVFPGLDLTKCIRYHYRTSWLWGYDSGCTNYFVVFAVFCVHYVTYMYTYTRHSQNV